MASGSRAICNRSKPCDNRRVKSWVGARFVRIETRKLEDCGKPDRIVPGISATAPNRVTIDESRAGLVLGLCRIETRKLEDCGKPEP